MLASKASEDWSTLKYPLLASPKLDGIRCVMRDGVAFSRTLKPIRNLHIQNMLHELPSGLDGELMVGDKTDPKAWAESQSGVMRQDGTPDFKYYVFDDFTNPYEPFHVRLESARLKLRGNPHCVHVAHDLILTQEELIAYEEACVRDRYEGAMIRQYDSPYKFGRSTAKEGYLLKLKRFDDYEMTIVDCEERMHNANEAKLDNFGRTERSTHKANMMPMDTLGAVVGVCSEFEGEFRVGTGFSDELRAELWAMHLARDETGQLSGLHGCLATFTSQGKTPDGKPRFPVWKGLRHKDDIS